jgi:hypothetical protein
VAKKLGWRADTKRPKPLTGVHPASVLRLLLIQSSYVRQCQKCQKPSEHPFGTFGTPPVSANGETTRPPQFYTLHQGNVLHPSSLVYVEDL